MTKYIIHSGIKGTEPILTNSLSVAEKKSSEIERFTGKPATIYVRMDSTI